MTLRQFKRRTYDAAKQLGYERIVPDIKCRIYTAESENEVSRIMTTARHKMGGVR